MASLKGKLFRFLIRHTNSLSPVKNPQAVGKIRSLTASQLNDKVPKGFVLSKETTPNGTAFDRVTKENAPKTGKVVYYLHGGAYVAGLLSFYRNYAKDFYEATGGCEVIYLDYHLAPEHTYPTQLNEALDLWDDLVGRQGYLPENIFVAGDSAGANLTMALMLKIRDTQRKMPRAGACLSLWGDMSARGESYIFNYKHDIMFGEKGKEITEESRDRLLASEIFSFVGDADRTCPYVSPVYGEYYDFPPMFFIAGGHEMLLSDTLTVMDKLKKCNVPVDCDIQDEMFHVYPIYGGWLPEGKISFQKLLDFIKAQYQ